MAAPNVVNTATLTFKNAKGALTTSAATIVNNAVSSNLAIKIISLYIANVDGTNSADVTINVYDQDDVGGTGTAIVSTVAVAADATVVVIDESSPIYLTEDMSLGGLASATGDLVYVASYQEINDA
jgi:hypothetical protein